ncbi:MAG: ABC transporter ATP-binding protein [Candidatus Brockarchaeota archaeon]|nr:ABC transporter ATP-binding protein [Candidatus Brockarchaeota archaeon]
MVEIEAKDAWFSYGRGVDALRGVSLRIESGERVAIMGENGAGKTTLVKLFNGLLKPTRGEVLVDNVSTRNSSVAQISRKVGMVFQKPENQFFAETVEEEIAFGLRNFGFKDVSKRVDEALAFASLEKYRGKSPFSLSGGEKKRLAIASVMAWEPEALLIDEPTIGQDLSQKVRLAAFLKEISSRGKTVVMVTHDVDFAAETCERAVLLSKGVVIGDDKIERIFSDAELMGRASLLQPSMARLLELLGVDKPAPGLLGIGEVEKLIAGTAKR